MKVVHREVETSPPSGDRMTGFATLECDTVTGLNLAVYREDNPGTGEVGQSRPAGMWGSRQQSLPICEE